ncbi:MAG: transporter substrate-binding domain-containing protein [Steroidobacteraceae bacterium]
MKITAATPLVLVAALLIGASIYVRSTDESAPGKAAEADGQATAGPTEGLLRVGSQQSFPPVEFRDGSARQGPSGVSVDLLEEIGRRLKLRIQYVHAEYSALIPGLRAERFDMISGGMSDTPEREELVDFVNYLLSGASILVRAVDKDKYSTIDDFCGKTLATLLGSRVIMEGVDAANVRCKQRGLKPIDLTLFPAAPDARAQVEVGRAAGYLADLPLLTFIMRANPSDFHIVGGNYVVVPYIVSWGFPKQSPLTARVREVAQSMIDDGTYGTIMAKWGLSDMTLPAITINQPELRSAAK